MLGALAMLFCLQSDVALDLRLVGDLPPMGAGLSGECVVEVVNTGGCSLPAGAPVDLSYHWLNDDGTMAVFEGERTPHSQPLELGTKQRINLQLKFPERAGRYRLRLDAVWEHRFWFSDQGSVPGPDVPVGVEPMRLDVRGEAPWWGASRTTRTVSVTISNAGSVPVRKRDHLRIGGGFRPVWLGAPVPRDLRVALQADLPPGASVTLEVPVPVPIKQGIYRFEWVMATEDGVVVGQAPARWPFISQKLTTLFALCGALMVMAAVLPPWRRRLRPFLPIAPWLWFITVVAWKSVRTAEITGNWPDARVALLAAASCAILGAPLLLLRWRARVWAFWGLNLVVSVALFGDILYFRYFDDFPSAATLAHAGQLGAVQASVPVLSSVRALILLADLPILALLLAFGLRRVPAPPSSRRMLAAAAGTALAVGLALAGWEAKRAGGAASPVFHQRFQNSYLAAELGPMNYHLYDLGAWIWREVKGRTLPEEERVRAERHFAAARRAVPERGAFWGRARGKSFLLIQEESFEAFALDHGAGGVPVMPFLRSSRGGCLEFTAFFDETAHGRTSDAEFMLLASLHPAAGGSAFFLHADNRFRTLAHVFREHGYVTLFAHPHERGFWNRYAAYTGFGFDRLLFKEEFAPGRTIGWGLANGDFFQQAVDRLRALPRPFFALLVTLTDHHPYQDLPVPAAELPLGKAEGTLLGRYLKVCREKDRALEGLARRLGEVGLLDETVIVIYGDHDAGLDWNLERMREAGLSARGPLDRYEQRRLPLLIHGPGLGGAVVPKAGGHMDLGPTVLDLAGLDAGGAPFLGRSLLAPGEGQAVFPDASYRTDRLRFVLRGLSGRPECWDLSAGAETDIARCRPDYDRGVERLRISSAILRGDLVPELMAEPGPADR